MPREMKESGIEWIGKIPCNWSIKRTKNCFSNHKDVVGNAVDDYQRLALTLNGVIKRDKDDVNGLQPEKFTGYQILKENELVFKLIDLKNISTSRVGLSTYTGIVSPAYIVLSPNGNINTKYAEYFYLSLWQREIFNHMGDDGVRSSLNSNDLLNIPITYPSITEQQKIANFLDEKVGEIDKVIAKTKDSIEEYHNLEKAIIQEAVTKGLDSNYSLVDSGVKYIGLIPENRDVKRVKYIASSILKGNGITKDEVIKNGNIQCIRYGEIYTKYKTKILETISRTNYEQISSPKQIEKGDILCAATGELVEEIGKNVVYMGDDKCLAGGDIIIVKHNQNPEYLNYALNSIGSQEQKSLGKTKLKVIHISASEIGDIKVALPSLIEQQEIVDYLNEKRKEIELLIENKSKIISDLEKYKKSLIYEYVTGKKVVL